MKTAALVALVALVALLALSACAAPGSETLIPQPVAIALAGGDVSGLPVEAWTAPPVRIDMRWYDRTLGFQIEGADHFVDLTSAASGENALQARRADNQLLGQGLDRILALGLAAATSGLAGAPQPATPPPWLEALLERVEALEGAAPGGPAP